MLMKILLQFFIYCCLCTTFLGAEVPQSKSILKNAFTESVISEVRATSNEPQQFQNAIPHGEHVTDFRALQISLLQTQQFSNQVNFDAICFTEGNLIVFKAFLNRVKQYYSLVCYLSGACSTVCIRSE